MAFITVERRKVAQPRYIGYSSNTNPRTGYPYSIPAMNGIVMEQVHGLGATSSQGVVGTRVERKQPAVQPLHPTAYDPPPPGYDKFYDLGPALGNDYKKNTGAYTSGMKDVPGGPDRNILVTDAELPGHVMPEFSSTTELRPAATQQMENSTIIDPEHLLPGNARPDTSLNVSSGAGTMTTGSSSFLSSIPSWVFTAGVVAVTGSMGLLIGRALGKR